MASTTVEQISIIRKRIKTECKTLSVRNSRGTAYGWVDVGGSGECGEFTVDEIAALKRLGMSYGGNFASCTPEERKSWAERLAKNPQAKYTACARYWD